MKKTKFKRIGLVLALMATITLGISGIAYASGGMDADTGTEGYGPSTGNGSVSNNSADILHGGGYKLSIVSNVLLSYF